MTSTDRSPPPAPSAATTAVGVEHVHLSYPYLDEGDLDGYASLLHRDVQLRRPDLPPARGREEVLRLLAGAGRERHHLYKVVGDGDCVVATGRLTRRPGPLSVDFADLVTLSDEGLILGIRRFYYTAPPQWEAS